MYIFDVLEQRGFQKKCRRRVGDRGAIGERNCVLGFGSNRERSNPKNLPSDLGEACLKVALFSFDPRQQSGCRVNHRLEVDCARTVSGCRCANPSRSKTWSRQA